jgi:hypothetical protein
MDAVDFLAQQAAAKFTGVVWRCVVTPHTPCGVAGWTRYSPPFTAPVKPAIPSGSVLLAEVYVASTTTAIAVGNIIDKTTTVRLGMGPTPT